MSMEDAQKKLDKALKRNLSANQQPSTAVTSSPKTATSDLPSEEPIGETEEADPIDE